MTNLFLVCEVFQTAPDYHELSRWSNHGLTGNTRYCAGILLLCRTIPEKRRSLLFRPVTPDCVKHFKAAETVCRIDPVQHCSSRIILIYYGAATVVLV